MRPPQVLSGFNVCVIVYGATGSGKTFALEGGSTPESQVSYHPATLPPCYPCYPATLLPSREAPPPSRRYVTVGDGM